MFQAHCIGPPEHQHTRRTAESTEHELMPRCKLEREVRCTIALPEGQTELTPTDHRTLDVMSIKGGSQLVLSGLPGMAPDDLPVGIDQQRRRLVPHREDARPFTVVVFGKCECDVWAEIREPV